MSFFSSRSDADAGVVVAGAGMVGLAVALELRRRGHRVTVVERGRAVRHASWAAAGMLAAEDPHNPAGLLELSRLSVALYPEFLERVGEVSGQRVVFQTETVVEYLEGGVVRRPEWSVDPRELGAALLAAVRASGVAVYEDVGRWELAAEGEGVRVRGGGGLDVGAAAVVHATGAWFEGRGVVRPRKGQMLRVQMPTAMPVTEVHRRADVYIVPRTRGAQAGTALIGATVEDVGFDVGTSEVDLEGLRKLAAELLPMFGDAVQTPMVEAWAGLRPGTPDGLPLLGAVPGSVQEFVATGHFRNGVLLAPATAVVVVDLVEGRVERVDLGAFAPGRFG